MATVTAAIPVAIASRVPLHRDALRAALSPLSARVVEPEELAGAAGQVIVIDRLGEGFDSYLDAAFHHRLPVVVWGGYLHPTGLQELVRRGADGYVSIIGSRDQLGEAVRAVHSGRSWLPTLPSQVPDGLTPAQSRVVRAYLIDQPRASRRQVADRLGLREATVKAHLANVRSRLDEPCASRISLRRALIARGWLELD